MRHRWAALTLGLALMAISEPAAAQQYTGIQNALIATFNDAALSVYMKFAGYLSLVCGYVLVLQASLKFAVLGDGRQQHEDSLGRTITTLIIGIVLVCLDSALSMGRASIGIDRFDTVNYGQFAGTSWAKDAIDSLVNLLRIIGVAFFIRSLFALRKAAHDRKGGHGPKAMAMMLSGISLTNSPAVLNWFTSLVQ